MKNLKKLLTLLLAVCVLASMLALTACSDPDNGNNGDDTPPAENTHTITIVGSDGTALSDVSLMVMSSDFTFTSNLTTDSDGKATFETDKEGINVLITKAPSGYTIPSPNSNGAHGTIESGSKEITITLEKKAGTTASYTYDVTIVDQNGDAVSGVKLQLCNDENCYSATTDENGKASIGMDSNNDVKLQILTVPDGYTIPDSTVDGGYHKLLGDDETSVTFAITKN